MTLDEEVFHTLLCEVEAITNSRPIRKAFTDPNDLEALLPNHLLLLKTSNILYLKPVLEAMGQGIPTTVAATSEMVWH